MSKFIPQKGETPHNGQVKPKLKVRITMKKGDKEEEHTLNEYDAFAMISDLNTKVAQLTNAVNGIMDAMEAATKEVQPKALKTESVDYSSLTLPKLKTTKSDGLSSDHIYPNASDKVKLQD